MKKQIIFILISFVVISVAFTYQGLKPNQKIDIKVKEPSGICYDKEENSFFVVSDNGKLYKLNKKFEKVEKASFEGIDFEGVCISNNLVVVSDETARKIYVFNKKNLKLLKTITINYNGGRNKGVEAITYNPQKKQFLVITEKEPIYIITLNDQFQQISEIIYQGASDISDVTFHNNNYYLLSDEDRKIIQLNESLEEQKSWEIPVVNPEGISFAGDQLIIASDDLQQLFIFNSNELK